MKTSRLGAIGMLVMGTAFWGFSFPLSKALSLAQHDLAPGNSGWFIAAGSVTFRFLLSTILLLLIHATSLRTLRKTEFKQGMALGLTGGIGLLFQMDGLQYTSASTSAFLTQFYCLILPILFAIQHRRLPSLRVSASCLMVLTGVAILSHIDWSAMKLGRGEWETLIASCFFTGQILSLDHPAFAQNRPGPTTCVMFCVGTLLFLPIALVTAHAPLDLIRIHSSQAALSDSVVLAIFCTLVPYSIMNHWQPRLTALQAGLIYCAEPLFGSLFALFLPALLSKHHHIVYPNEFVTWTLLLGGGLITAANILIQTESHEQLAT